MLGFGKAFKVIATQIYKRQTQRRKLFIVWLKFVIGLLGKRKLVFIVNMRRSGQLAFAKHGRYFVEYFPRLIHSFPCGIERIELPRRVCGHQIPQHRIKRHRFTSFGGANWKYKIAVHLPKRSLQILECIHLRHGRL